MSVFNIIKANQVCCLPSDLAALVFMAFCYSILDLHILNGWIA